jgi:beta-ureidopropionase / N-carbamoyl-L-amino-acid hydrolase
MSSKKNVSLDQSEMKNARSRQIPTTLNGGSKPLCPINGERLWASIMMMAEFGALPGGGCARLALTDEDRAARNLFVQWCREADCSIKIDPFGNIFAIRSGRDPARPVVLLGSHLDTQPHGGRFDGVYGVMAGLEVVRAMNEAGIETEASVVVVNWTNEEGVRFAPGLTGSSAFAGLMIHNNARDIVSQDGRRFADELSRIGFDGNMARDSMPIAAYLEPHIEQGPVLENVRKLIGIVTGVQGVRWFNVGVEGADRHAGTTPMNVRQDSFMAASRLVLRMRKFALDVSPDIRFTVGRAEVLPGSPNTVPGLTRFVLDLRHQGEDVLDTVAAELCRQASEIGREERVKIDVSLSMEVKPVMFDRRTVDLLSRKALALDMSCERMISGAMHDASSIARVAPTAMLFVPCRNGISHAEEEWAEPEHLAAGCQVVAEATVELAEACSLTA